MQILSLGKKIKLHRKQLNMTLKDLAGDRITAAQISHIERDKSYPSQDLLSYFAKKLGVTVDYLVETKESQTKRYCETLLLEAETLIFKEQHQKAIEKIMSMIKIIEEYEVIEEEAKAKYLLGMIYLKNNETIKATSYFEESIRLYAGAKDSEGVVRSYLQLGLTYYYKDYFRSALDKFHQAEIVIQKKKMMHLELELKTYFYIALCYIKMGQGKSAIDYALKANQLQQKMENPKEYGETLSLLATGYMEKGEMELAKKCLYKALEIYKKNEEKKEITLIEDSLGYIYMRTERHEDALEHLQNSYLMKKQSKDRTLPETIFELICYYIKTQQYDHAEEMTREAMSFSKEHHAQDYYLTALSYLAQIYKYKEDYVKSMEIMMEVIELLKSSPMPKQLAKCYLELADLYARMKEESKSLDYYKQGIEILNHLGIIAG